MFGFLDRKPQKKFGWRELVVEPTNSKDTGPCSCCGNMSRTVWGFVHLGDSTLATYFVQWTLNNPAHGANLDFIVGEWGEEAKRENRQAISMEYRITNRQGAFMVIDASTRPIATSELVGTVLDRTHVIAQPIADTAFAIADAVFLKDARLEEIRSWH